MNMILIAAVLMAIVAMLPYAVYIVGMQHGLKQQRLSLRQDYPPISVVISAYNEYNNLEKRIKNLANCQYPDMEVVFVDDKSSDQTAMRAKFFLNAYKLNYRLIENTERMGTSRSYNNAIRQATRDIVIVTDADVVFKRDAIHRLVTRLMSTPKIGAVTGDLQPFLDGEKTTGLESQYRSVYGKMAEWESAHDSTFNFNGAIMAFRKSAVGQINTKTGADDATLAFAVIRHGYRAVYETGAVVYEDIPSSFKIQYKQKVRRATGLLEAVMANKDLMNTNRPFGYFYMLRAFMLLLSPILIVASILSVLVGTVYISPILTVIVLAVLLSLILLSDFATSFFLNQIYLIRGLLNIGRDVSVWESTTSLKQE